MCRCTAGTTGLCCGPSKHMINTRVRRRGRGTLANVLISEEHQCSDHRQLVHSCSPYSMRGQHLHACRNVSPAAGQANSPAGASNTPKSTDKGDVVAAGKVVDPSEKSKRQGDRHALKRLFKETMGPESSHIGVGVIAMFASSAANMAFPSIVGKVLDRTSKRGSADRSTAEPQSVSSLQAFMLRAVLVFLGGAVASCVRTHCLRMAKEGTCRRLRKALLKSLLRQEKAFFDDPEHSANRTGQLLSVIESDVEAAGEVFTTRLADGLRSMSSALNGTVMLLRLSPKLTAVSLGLVPVFSAAIITNVLLTKRLSERQRELAASAAAFAGERLTNATTVHAFTSEDRDVASYASLLDEAYGLSWRVSLAKGVFMGGLFFAGSATLTSVLFFGGTLAGRGEISVGDLTSFSMYTGLVGLGYSGVSSWISDTLKSSVAARRVFDLLDREPAVDPEEGVHPALPAQGNIRFDDVHFEYPSRPGASVLQGLNLEIPKGKVVALVGTSGAGKSTVLSLLLRLYEPSKGRVVLDGVEASSLKPSWLRQQIGLVDQEPALFSGTIADNISYGRPEATREEIIKAAVDANAHDFIVSFPQAYETFVGERGKTQLSGGQRQRIALARALIKQPPILLLDEATSALDNESERMVKEALERAMQGRTVIIVAHRLSTVEKADEIVLLEAGQIKERGSFKELMDLPEGAFRALYSAVG